MINLARIELLKLRTTPALLVTVLATVGLALASAITNILMAGHHGTPPAGSRPDVTKVLNQPAAVTCVAMFILGVVIIAGEYRQRTIVSTYLAQPRRGRILVAKLLVTSAIGAALAACTFALTWGVAVPLYATRGVHHLGVQVGPLWAGTVIGGACFALLGVALGALTRSTVAAIVGGIIWIQLIEVTILQSAVPALAKWLPTGAAVALTTTDRSAHLLAPAAAGLVLVAWAAAVTVLATGISVRREIS